MYTWVEVEDGYVTNQPLKFVSCGRGREKIGDPDKPPTQAFMFCYQCTKMPSGEIKRQRYLKVIEVEESPQLGLKIAELVSSPGVTLIEPPEDRNAFISGGLPAVPIVI